MWFVIIVCKNIHLHKVMAMVIKMALLVKLWRREERLDRNVKWSALVPFQRFHQVTI